ncbi:MAG: hypothetical protein F6K48_08180 [Okeania sp. SIO3H1]|nr:hypothetical protein [Okeania sp. SIO3H1]
MLFVGDRRQPTPNPSQEGRNGNYRGGRRKNNPLIILRNYEPKMLKPLYVNTFRINQQALLNSNIN